MTPGTYSVKCLRFSNAQAASMTPDSCTKTIIVKDQSDASVQGCSKIYAYKGNTLSDDMSNVSAFDPSFRCGSRLDTGTSILPYRFTQGNQTVFLWPRFVQYSWYMIYIKPTPSYTFNTATDVVCAVKVGDGYKTMITVRSRTRIGTDCFYARNFHYYTFFKCCLFIDNHFYLWYRM